MERTITTYQAVKDAVEILGSINIPVKHMQEIGGPIMLAMDNLNACIKAWDEEAARAAAAAKEAPQDAPEETTAE